MKKIYIDRKSGVSYSGCLMISVFVNVFFAGILLASGLTCSSNTPMVRVSDSEADVSVSITVFDFDDD